MPRMPSKTSRLAAATYAHPRNGFFPPIHDTVEMTTDLVPLYGRTGKSARMVCQRGTGVTMRECALMLIVIWYRPFASVVVSLRPQSFVNVGRPAVRIQFWKCSSSLRFGGGVEFVYPFGKRRAQLGGGVISEMA